MAVLPIGIGSAVAGGYQIERSLRFNSADSAYLNRTFGTPTNQIKWTISLWLKRSEISVEHMIYGSYPGSGESFFTLFYPSTLNTYISTSITASVTNAVFRDGSGWYHLVQVFDSANATAADRFITYMNGVRQTTSSLSVTQNDTVGWNSSGKTGLLGRGADGAGWFGDKRDYFDGYLTEINFVDGQALTPSDFGETDSNTGVWKPKSYSGTYGNNGFYLKFADNSGTTSTTLGKDSSGNGNNWTPNNFSVTAGAGNDSLVDTPTAYGTDTGAGGEVRGNYATLNPVDVTGSTLTNGNLNASIPFATNSICKGTLGLSSGKWYWEVTPTGGGVGGSGILVQGQAESYYPGYSSANGISYLFGGQVYRTGSAIQTYSSFTSNDVIGIALDLDNGKVFFAKNGTWQGSSDPAAGTNSAASTGISGNTWVPAGGNSSATAATQVYNFGQRAFAYTAPSGFKALCTQNLPTPTIGATSTTQANDYFNAVLWTGNTSTAGVTQAISGVGFQPDFLWAKTRNQAFGHYIYDSIRGVGSSGKRLNSAATTAEATNGEVNSFDSDGFTVKYTDTNVLNWSSSNNVGWAWKANGAGSTNTAGTITSTVSANTTSGFSIVTYTGNFTASQTVGHGLSTAPVFIITKRRDSTSDWGCIHPSLAATQIIRFNLTGAAETNDWFANTRPTSSVFYVGQNSNTNPSGGTMVAYCFAPVAGYSAFGSYTGNGSTDGPFIFTNFRPRFVIRKCSGATGNWFINDAARDSSNVVLLRLNADLSDAESSGANSDIDFLSNGFKIRATSTAGVNQSGQTHIYMAFAENPFKYSLAR